jgi:hypothetical protein
MTRCPLPAFAGLLLLCACAGTRGGRAYNDLPRWPYSGITRLTYPAIGSYQGFFFSGQRLEIDPTGTTLFAESGIPGSISVVALPQGTIQSVFDLGHGTIVENMVFHPDGNQMFILASTVQPENYGEVQLARALLKVDYQLPLLLVPIALKPDGYSHGLVLLERDGLVFSLDTAGSDLSGGATLSRIDLLVDDLTLRRPVGNLPPGVRRRGLATDERGRRLYALLTENEAPSDFDPPSSRQAGGGMFLAAIATDSLKVVERMALPEGPQWYAVVPTPRGVLVAGTTARGTSLIEVDTQWMRQVAWLDVPDVTNDVVATGSVAVLPSRFGLYVVDLNLLSIQRFIPVDFDRPTEVALTPTADLACVMLEHPRWPGKPALGIIDLKTGGLDKIVQ